MRALAWAVAGALLLGGCAAGGKAADGGYVGGDGSLTRVPVADRTAAPVLTGTSLEGTPMSTADLAGKVIVVNVWGSWCPPCRKEAPALAAAASRTADKAAFVGIATRDHDAAPALAFQRQFAVPYRSFHDPDGALLLQLSGQIAPNAIPSTLVIDPQGRVAARVLGEASEATLVGLVDDVAAGR